MSDPQQPSKPEKETRPHKATSKVHGNARAAALEKALRENLRRRKAAVSEAPQTLHEKAKENPEGGT